MTFKSTATAAAAVFAALAAQPAAAMSEGSLYSFHTGAMGACPGLDWHVILTPDNRISGFVAWDNMQHMALLNGTMEQNRSFAINVKEVAGTGRSGVVKGAATGDYINASLEGSGTACDGKPLEIPRVVGGISGGGG